MPYCKALSKRGVNIASFHCRVLSIITVVTRMWDKKGVNQDVPQTLRQVAALGWSCAEYGISFAMRRVR